MAASIPAGVSVRDLAKRYGPVVAVSGVTFEVVGSDTPVTAMFTTPAAPVNLDFQQ